MQDLSNINDNWVKFQWIGKKKTDLLAYTSTSSSAY